MIQRLRYSQNVAGLWLLYGAKSPKTNDFNLAQNGRLGAVQKLFTRCDVFF